MSDDFNWWPNGPDDPDDDRDGSAMQDAILAALSSKDATRPTGDKE